MSITNFLEQKLEERRKKNAFRTLRSNINGIDFSSNDYLGVVTNGLLNESSGNPVLYRHGSTGSRLLTGNNALIEETETFITNYHDAESGLIFNSGYDANMGLLSCVPSKGDTIYYDALSHASIRDGIRLGAATSYSFIHNDPSDLEKKLQQAQGNVFVVTESVFSMDGDVAPLTEIAEICNRYGAALIVDEAHATGVIGERGEGVVQVKRLQQKCFARIHTFGKALGTHGAIVLGSNSLRDYLINFSRPFLYTTALPESAIAACKKAYELLPSLQSERHKLHTLIEHWKRLSIKKQLSANDTAIQYILYPGNSAVKKLADNFLQAGFDARPILYPSVPEGAERIRIVLHSFNTTEQISNLVMLINSPLIP